MSSPLATERIVRAILRSFVHAGIIPSYSDVAKIEAIPNNYTDAQIDGVLATISYGTVMPGTDVISGTEDVNVFVDSDNNDTPSGFVRYFRVAQNQAVPPVTNASSELMTVGQTVAAILSGTTTLTVGPRDTLILPAEEHTGCINIGANQTYRYGALTGGNLAVNGDAGLDIKVRDALGLRADEVRVYNPTGSTIRGGWSDTTGHSRFHFGNFAASPSDSLVVETYSGAGPEFENYIFRTERSTGTYIKRLYFRGSEVNTYATCVIVGGHETEAYGNPANLGNATFAAVGSTWSPTANVAFIYDRNTGRDASSDVFSIKSATPSTTIYNHIRCYTEVAGVFRVTSQGNVYCSGAYNVGGADVAESFPSDRDYVVGTVMVVNNGVCTASTSRAQNTVVGAVSTKPGVEIGQDNVYTTTKAFPLTIVPITTATQTIVANKSYTFAMLGTHVWVNRSEFIKINSISEDQNVTTLQLADTVEPGATLEAGVIQASHYVSLALCGFVPVRCSTEYGDITGSGDLLVSGPNGCAVLAPSPPVVGTILGKAFSPLYHVEDGIIEYGTVNVLIALQ